MTDGYDSAISSNGCYDSSFNAALDVTSDNPLTLSPGSSLVSTISIASPAGYAHLSDAAVLAALDSAPPPGSFRPAYSGSDKTIRLNVSVIKYDMLPGPWLRYPASVDCIRCRQIMCHAETMLD